jgi:hypothetical protein
MAGILAVGTPQRSKSRKKPKNQTSTLKTSKMASFTSFSQINEVRPVVKTAQLDLLNEEEKKWNRNKVEII